jgi:GT2 family glycosyltransferase
VITRVGGITLGNSPAYRIPNGAGLDACKRWPLQSASKGEDARVERNGPEPEAGCQLPHADASSKEREKPKGRPMRERTQDQSSSDLDRHENSACRKTAVLVLNWNNAAATLDCLAYLQGGPSELQAVAIDNGSSDGSADLIARVYPDVPLVRLPNNEGFARGTNAGIRWVLTRDDYDVVVFLNNDALLSADDLLRATEMIRKDHSIGLLTGKIPGPDGRLWYRGGRLRRWRGGVGIFGVGRPDRGQCDVAADVTFIPLAFAVTRRDVIERVGLLADEYFFGREDWDYSLRVRKAGYRLRYDPSIHCIHGGEGSHNSSSPEFVYNSYRNKLIFKQRYLPRWAFPVWRTAFDLYARTILPATCVWVHGTKLPLGLLRFCALEALRDHAPGRRIEESDLLDFRHRAKAFGARAMPASGRLP